MVPEQEVSIMDRLAARVAAGPSPSPETKSVFASTQTPDPPEQSQQAPALQRWEQRVADRLAGKEPEPLTEPAQEPPTSALDRWTQRLLDKADDKPPGEAEGYDFSAVKDMQEVDRPHFDAFKKVALEAGLTKKQAATVAEKFYEHSVQHNLAEISRQQAELDREREATEASYRETTSELEGHWGITEVQKNLDAIKSFTKDLSQSQFTALVNRLLYDEAKRRGM